jgi:dienelactone hydrolase
MGRKIDLALGVLNGAVGDYLVRTDNGLALPMALHLHGEPVAPTPAALAAAYPEATARVVVLVHGLMNTEDIFAMPGGRDYGTLLRDDLGLTPLYVRYNSGLPIADNGAALSALLSTLLGVYPVPIGEIVLLGYSMGGLVLRAATHAAALSGAPWLPRVRRALYVGTPHRGAPTERVGRVVSALLRAIPDPYTRLIADVADLRSDGLKDLGDADLRHEDRARRTLQVTLRDPQHPVPLLPSISHHLVAGALSDERWVRTLFGDAVVPVSSATGWRSLGEGLDPSRVKVFPGMSHAAIPRSLDVYAQLRQWCAAP